MTRALSLTTLSHHIPRQVLTSPPPLAQLALLHTRVSRSSDIEISEMLSHYQGLLSFQVLTLLDSRRMSCWLFVHYAVLVMISMQMIGPCTGYSSRDRVEKLGVSQIHRLDCGDRRRGSGPSRMATGSYPEIYELAP